MTTTAATAPAPLSGATQAPLSLLPEQVAFYQEHGYLRIPQVYSSAQVDVLEHELNYLLGRWASDGMGWTGPWRKVYMDEATEKKSKLIAMHDLQLYSSAWNAAVNQPRLCDALVDLIGPNIELHHTTLHAKPPETGHPFPMHQDWAFYKHTNDRYIDVLVHLDDTSAENGEIRFLDGSHRFGALEHVVRTPEGEGCTPHLPTDRWKLEDTVAVPARRGDVVLFNIHTIHGSYINRTDRIRRLVRLGYRDPENAQIEGQSSDRLGPMVRGLRPKGGATWTAYVEE